MIARFISFYKPGVTRTTSRLEGTPSQRNSFAVIITVKTRGACVIARSYPGIGPRVRLVDGPVWAELMRNVMVLSRPNKCKVRDRVGSV